MRIIAIAVLFAGLAAGVISMVGGIDQRERGGTRVKYLNLPTFGAAATVFGIVGYPVATYTALSTAAILGIAGVSSLAAGAAMVAVIAGWAVPSAAKEIKDDRFALQGQFARVTRTIGESAGGEIEYVVDQTPHRVSARSLTGGVIEAGTDVVIERIENATAFVERWSKIAQQLELPA